MHSIAVDYGSKAIYKGYPKNGVRGTSIIELEEDDLVAIFHGQANPQQLFLERKLRVSGNFANMKSLITLVTSVASL